MIPKIKRIAVNPVGRTPVVGTCVQCGEHFPRNLDNPETMRDVCRKCLLQQQSEFAEWEERER